MVEAAAQKVQGGPSENKALIPQEKDAGAIALRPPSSQLPALPERDPYQGIAAKAFPAKAQEILQGTIDPADVEIRPDGIVYLPEIMYRRVLNRAFGAGGWALMPREKLTMQDGIMYQRWQLMVDGRYASEAVGEQEYFANNQNMTFASAAEATKSNAMMRCCKDLGISSELWTPSYIENWKKQYAIKVFRQKAVKMPYQWRRKDREPFYDEAQTQQQVQKLEDTMGFVKPTSHVAAPAPGEPQRKPKAAVAPPPTAAAKPAAPPQGMVASAAPVKPPTAPAPAHKPPLTWRGIITEVAEKKGTTNGSPWTMWRINGEDFGAVTFDSNLADEAQGYQMSLAVVDIGYQQGARGPVILSLAFADVKAAGDAGDAMDSSTPPDVIDAAEGR
jgi:hypothetical protein